MYRRPSYRLSSPRVLAVPHNSRCAAALLTASTAAPSPQAVAEKYYRGPRGRLAAATRAAPSWPVLRDVWFKEEGHEGDGLGEEKTLALQVCRRGGRGAREEFGLSLGRERRRPPMLLEEGCAVQGESCAVLGIAVKGWGGCCQRSFCG